MVMNQEHVEKLVIMYFIYDCLHRWFEWQKSCPVYSSGFKSLPKKEHGRSIGLTEIQEERSNQCSVE